MKIDKRYGKFFHMGHTHKTLTNMKKCTKTPKDKILLVGRAASGKSTTAKYFKKKGYYILSTDDVIKNDVIPKFMDKIDGSYLYSVQNKTNNKNKTWIKSQKYFHTKLKKLVKKYDKILVEGQLAVPHP